MAAAAAALEPGSYRLRNHGTPTGSTKRFIFAKLTDSCQTALEEWMQTKDRKGGASFHLGEKDGFIRLPSGEEFSFRVDEILEKDSGPQGSFECIQTIRRGEVEHVSDIRNRITVQATEASFEHTRQRMAKADEDNKKSCVKKMDISNVSRHSKVGIKRPGETVPLTNSSKKLRLDGAVASVSPHNSPFGRTNNNNTALPGGGSRGLTSSASQPVISPSFTSAPGVSSSSQQKRPPHLTPPPHPSSRSSSSQPPAANSSSLSSSSSSTLAVPENSMSMSSSGNSLGSGRSPLTRSPTTVPVRPLRERLIQTLALRPMTKPDLISKLRKFGYKDEERAVLEQLLTEVASVIAASAASSEGLFELLPGCFGQVDAKWSLYSPADQAAAAKRLAAFVNARPSAAGSSAAAGGSTVNGNKHLSRTASASDLFPSSSSAPSLASSSRPPGRPTAAAMPAITTTSSSKNGGKNSAELERLQNEMASARVQLAHPNPGDDLSPPPPSNSSCSTPSPPDHSKFKDIGNSDGGAARSKKTSNTSDVGGSVGHGLDDDQAMQGDRENSDRYRAIATTEQRRKYKEDFYSEYTEYKELHGQMARISDQFTQWERHLNGAVKHSAEYQRYAEMMRAEYKRLKKDDDYSAKRGRWNHLFNKLTLIKTRIKAYDALHKKA
ncbi:hypothetical protein BV898_01890 [Hypsibius exemplaris]|uniref:OCEL domain-containing protein n=1 Tax=Hypsibius exemplaris TaxID=2072580 RepID=A0A1W0XAK5_HYPEX|nr:hypothetical protein BV898_01890 [Hypsibius exemplaris]